MLKEDCFYLGRIFKKRGFRGEVVAKLDTDFPQLYKKLTSIFLAIDDVLVPYFISTSSLQNKNFLRIKFENINSEEEANQLLKCDLHLPLSELPQLTGNQFYFHEVIGFLIVDNTYGEVGKIKRIIEHTSQALFEVETEEGVVLIPIVDSFLKEIDRKHKKVLVDTPEGLLDLYHKN